MFRILVINPGSTTTKIGIYDDDKPVFIESINHTMKEIDAFKSPYDQYDFREKAILNSLDKKGIDINTINCTVGRGGLLKPIVGGTYVINGKMLEDLWTGVQGIHACNLGCILAYNIGHMLNVPSYTVDPVVVDEMDEVAKLSGMPEIRRRSVFHALNQRAVARRYAKGVGKKYEELNLIVTHMGGGISVGAHRKGRIVDVNNALDGEGPFSPERSGSLPVGDLIKLCYSGKYTYEQMKKLIVGKGGLVAYLNTNDARQVEKMIKDGNEQAALLYDAMAYQISKQIGMTAAVLKGEVDAILLTGGLAYSNMLVEKIKDRVEFISGVAVFPGEDELLALAEGGLRVLKGEEVAKEYV